MSDMLNKNGDSCTAEKNKAAVCNDVLPYTSALLYSVDRAHNQQMYGGHFASARATGLI